MDDPVGFRSGSHPIAKSVKSIREGAEKLRERRTVLISAAVTGKIGVRNYVSDQDDA